MLAALGGHQETVDLLLHVEAEVNKTRVRLLTLFIPHTMEVLQSSETACAATTSELNIDNINS